MIGWGARRWIVAALVALVVATATAIPTDLIDTPLFTREIAITWWSWPVLVANSLLAGLLAASYVRAATPTPAPDVRANRPGWLGSLGGLATFFAVGCPVCNKLVLLAVGYSGAIQFFEPVQPFLALGATGLLGWALSVRLRRERACALPARA